VDIDGLAVPLSDHPGVDHPHIPSKHDQIGAIPPRVRIRLDQTGAIRIVAWRQCDGGDAGVACKVQRGGLGFVRQHARMWIGASPRCCAASSAAKLLRGRGKYDDVEHVRASIRRCARARRLSPQRLHRSSTRQPKACQRGNAGVCRITRDDHGVANAAIEGAPHFTLRNIAFALQQSNTAGSFHASCRA